MIDISQDDFGEKISSSQRILTEKNIQEVAELYRQFLGNQELSKNGLLVGIVSEEKIKEGNYILVPARYLSQNEIELKLVGLLLFEIVLWFQRCPDQIIDKTFSLDYRWERVSIFRVN